MKAPGANSNTFYLGFDTGASTLITAPANNAWTWVNCGSTVLSVGSHQLNLTYGKGGLSIDQLAVTSDTGFSAPAGKGTELHYVDAASFKINVAANFAVNSTAAGLSTSGKFLYSTKPVGTTPATGTAGDAQRTIYVNGGTYDIWVRMQAQNSSTNAFYYALDNGAYSTVTLAGTTYGQWFWQKVSSNVTLAAGAHVLNVNSDKATLDGNNNVTGGCLLDRFFVAATGTAAPTEPNSYLTAMRNLVLTSIGYATWGAGSYGNNDLAAASQLIGMSLVYDWCYGVLSPADHALIANTLNTKGGIMYTAVNGGGTGVAAAWWRARPLQNHSWAGNTGLAFAGLAIHDAGFSTGVVPWLQTALNGISTTLNDLGMSGNDGADHEGPDYWGGIQDVLRFMDVAKKEMGADMTNCASSGATSWMSQTGTYRLYSSTALGSGKTGATSSGPMVNFNDSVTYVWAGPDYQLCKLASMYNLPNVQWLAGRYDDSAQNDSDTHPTGPALQWLNFLWYDPSIPETAPTVPFMHFPDLGLVFSRSGWTGADSVVGLQCGPYQGHAVQAYEEARFAASQGFNDLGAGHEHPAANNFCFYYGGDWQIMNGGYNEKQTAYDNSLLVGGTGQAGETTGFDVGFNGAPAAQVEDPGGTLNPAIDANGEYLAAPPGTPTNSPDALATADATYNLPVPADGTYSIWVRIYATDGTTHSFYWKLNPGANDLYTTIAATQTFGSWQWVKVTSATLTQAGPNVLGLKYRQGNAKIDQFIVTSDSSYTPEGKY